MTTLEKITKIAEFIRDHCEEFYRKECGVDSIPHDIITLGGWCHASSQVLFKELRRRNIRANLTWNWGHCFVTYGPYLIDITATQFDPKLEKVAIRVRNEVDHKTTTWWQEEMHITNMTDFNIETDWVAARHSISREWQEQALEALKELTF